MLTRSTTLPEYLSTLTPAERAEAKSHLFNIFRCKPLAIKILRRLPPDPRLPTPTKSIIYQLDLRIFSNPDPKGSIAMPLNKNIRVCTHIKVNGVPCGSPALRGEIFCYFHQRMIRGVRTPAKVAPSPHRPDRRRRRHPGLAHGDHQRPGSQHHRLSAAPNSSSVLFTSP